MPSSRAGFKLIPMGEYLPPEPCQCRTNKGCGPQKIHSATSLSILTLREERSNRSGVYNQPLPTLLRLLLLPRVRLLAEILFVRRQLALFQEREAKACRPSRWAKQALVWLSRLFDWREALVIVKTETFIRWHREGFRLLWRWKS